MSTRELARVTKEARRVEEARRAFAISMRDAQAAGHSLRAIADRAGLSHERVRQLIAEVAS